MRAWLLLVLLLGLLLTVTWAKQSRSERRQRDRQQAEDEQTAEVDDDDDDDDDDEEDDEYTEEVDVEQREQKQEQQKERPNPCLNKTCRRGEICMTDAGLRAKCICIPKCTSPPEDDDRYQVCSKRNVTYHSECELDRDHCLCRRQQEGCSRPGTGKIRLDYYGPCQKMTECTEREYKEFPGRMREWLFIIMQQLAQRAEIPDYLEMLDEARHEANHSHAVIWKFCDLDVKPRDRFVSRGELLYTIQSLKAMEHCLIPFLNDCDTDDDDRITLWEWGRCLGLPEDKIKDDCKTIRKARRRS